MDGDRQRRAAGINSLGGSDLRLLPGGGVMYAVAAPEQEVAAELAAHGGVVSIAAVNGPAAVVISGLAAPAGQVAEVLAGRGRRVRQLRVSHGFHSALMDPILDQLSQAAAHLVHRAPGLVRHPVLLVRAGAESPRRAHLEAPESL